tara:strand:- start:2793 stop:3779 length:987 start_codon:yes stop_codon:yes gene_type:complete
MPAGPHEEDKHTLASQAKRAERQLANLTSSAQERDEKRVIELEERLRRTVDALQAAKDQFAEERTSLREQLATAHAENRAKEEKNETLQRQLEALQREKAELQEGAQQQKREEREKTQEERELGQKQLEQLQRLETLARRSQADNDAMQATFQSTSQRAEQLATEREECVRRSLQAEQEMVRMQSESRQIVELSRHTIHLAHQEKGAMAQRVELAEGRCSKLLAMVEAGTASATASAQQLAVARSELRSLEERCAALQGRAERSESWSQLLLQERDAARDEMTRLSHLSAVQESVNGFTADAMRERFRELSQHLAGEWPDEWRDALCS